MTSFFLCLFRLSDIEQFLFDLQTCGTFVAKCETIRTLVQLLYGIFQVGIFYGCCSKLSTASFLRLGKLDYRFIFISIAQQARYKQSCDICQ